MIFFPPAKINLGLRVLFKRSDGYHEIDSCMLPIPLVDVLEIIPSAHFSFQQTGLIIPGNNSDNLCVKAYELMKDAYSLPPVYIHLRKEIPMGAGLGGGSADAAYVLRALNSLFDLKCTSAELEEKAAQLGSDCPFFIKDIPQIAKGRGEVLSPCNVSLKGYYLKIVNPGIHVGTKEAYEGIVLCPDAPSVQSIVEGPIESWKDQLVNDFEFSVFAQHPMLVDLKSTLYNEGAVYASMSGSGSTMFGVYKDEPSLTFQDDSTYLEKIIRFS
jgi:4-diphosphocytidyl-2-C-methyl-D-erythritol kinase